MSLGVSEPLVSIIMNCFNGERFLKNAIESVYAQTYLNWEIIFWDNRSTDSSAAIAGSYDHRIRYFLAEERTVLGEARVLASKEAKGQYIAFLDCDDLWYPDKLKNQVQLIKSNDCAMVYGRCQAIDANGNKYKKSIIHKEDALLPEGNLFGDLVCENFIPFVSALVDKAIFFECGGFPKHSKHSTDYWIFLHIAFRHDIYVIQDLCCEYRIHDDNLSNFQHVICAEEDVDLVKSFLPDPRAIDGLRIKRINLSIAFWREGKFVNSLLNMVRFGGWIILIRRLFLKLSKHYR